MQVPAERNAGCSIGFESHFALSYMGGGGGGGNVCTYGCDVIP